MIPLHEPFFDNKELKSVSNCIKNGWISGGGNFTNKLEKKITRLTKSKYATCIINCTSALQISLKVSGLKPNNEVIVPTITFISTINSIIYNNAKPIFMDVNEDIHIDEEKTLDFIKNYTYSKNGNTYNKKTHNKLHAIIIVHTFGNAASFEKLFLECKKKNIKIIEDAAEAIGVKFTKGKFKNKYVGTIGDFGCISFNGNKIITSGGGGTILTQSKNNFKRIEYLINQAKNDSINFVHNEVGYNMKMSNLLSAVGCAQFNKLSKYVSIKKAIYQNYINELAKKKNFNILKRKNFYKSNYWLNVLKIDLEKSKYNKLYYLKKLLKKNIQVRSIWYPNHLQLPFKKYSAFNITNALNIFNNSICLPSSINLKKIDLKKIITQLDE